MNTLTLDIRVALRFFLRRLGPTVVMILTVSLALAANTAAFAVLKAFLLSELGVPQANRLHVISQTQNGANFLDAWPNFVMLRERTKAFDSVAAVLAADISWAEGEETLHVSGARATAGFLKAMRVAPAIGREWTEQEQGPNPAPVVMISQRLWRSTFGGGSDVLSRSLRLNGAPHSVIGVMPEGFALPPDVDVWLPFDLPKDAWTRVVGARQLFVFGRLRDGVSAASAQDELVAFGKAAEAANLANKNWSYASIPVREYYLSGADGTIVLVQLGAAILLLLAATNLSSLLLAWAAERQRETAVRLALGAASRDIARQHLVQSLLLMLTGTLFGIALTQAVLPALRALNPTPTLSFFLEQLRVDRGVMIFTAAIAILTGLIVGLIPLWQTRRTDLTAALKLESRGGTASRGALRVQRGMAVAQSAITVMVLSTALLSIASFNRASEAGPGYSTEGRGVFRVQLPESVYPDNPSRIAVMKTLLDRLAQEPELQRFGITTTLPFGDIPAGSGLLVEQANGEFTTEPRIFGYRRVSPDYMATMGIALRQGRTIEANDDESKPTVALVSQSLADKYWPAGDALGKRFRRNTPGLPSVDLTIVGVVGTVKDTGNAAAARTGETIYIPYPQNPQRKFSVVVRGRSDIDSAIAAGVRALRSAAPGVAAYDMTTLKQLAWQANATSRLQMSLLSIFALVAVGVALLGSYGIMSQLASNRERELAVRLALGDNPGGILRRMLVQGGHLAALGVLVGGTVSWMGGRFVQSLVAGVDARSPWTYVAVAAATLGLTQLAALFPARRAAATNVQKTLASS